MFAHAGAQPGRRKAAARTAYPGAWGIGLKNAKIPESVLVVIHTPALEVLILERADRPGFWQSVTGSKDSLGEPLVHTARRELEEETGFVADAIAGACLTDWVQQNSYEIYPHWRHRYAAGVTRNTEHVFGFCLPEPLAPRLAVREHLRFLWLPWRDAAERCFSMTNVAAIQQLPGRMQSPS
jgi:dATP pyrophosphohydrolase